MTQLPNIGAKIVVDDSQLKNVGGTASKTGAALEAGIGKGKTSLTQFSTALSGVLGQAGLGGMPIAALKSGDALEGMAGKGISGMTLLGGAALAGGAILTTVIGEGISKYEELAGQVENYKRVTGASADESGRMVQTFTALGVSEDTATAGMFKLSKAIDTTPKKLEDLGVVIARNAAGNVDLSKTLFNVADAYNAAAGADKKNLILFDAFGKSGKDMIPILEQGSVALQQFEKDAHITFSEQDLQRAKDYQIQLAQLKQGWDALGEAIGQKAVPALLGASDALSKQQFIQDGLNKASDEGTLSAWDLANAQTFGVKNSASDLIDKLVAEYNALHAAKTGFDAQAQATLDAAAAAALLIKTSDDLISTEDKLYKLTETIADQRDKVTSATWDVRDAEKTLADDRKKYGPNSEQAIRDAIALRGAQQSLSDTIKQGGQDRRQQVIDQEALIGPNRDLNAENAAAIAYYTAEEKKVGKGSPLYKKLQEWIALLETVPGNADTSITANYRAPVGTGKTQHFAAGGRPPVGVPSWIGEEGKELWVPDAPGTVVPHAAAAAAAATDAGPSILHQSTQIDLILEGQALAQVIDRRVSKLMRHAT
jgi:hypothetical protein